MEDDYDETKLFEGLQEVLEKGGGAYQFIMKNSPQAKELAKQRKKLDTKITELAKWIKKETPMLVRCRHFNKKGDSTIHTRNGREVEVPTRDHTFKTEKWFITLDESYFKFKKGKLA